MYRKAYRSQHPVSLECQLNLFRSTSLYIENSYDFTDYSKFKVANMTGYENVYRKEIQALNIGKRTMELSMLEYSERMREISLRRGQNNMSLTSLYNRVPGVKRWVPNNKTQNEVIIEELPPWKAFAEKSKRIEEKGYLPEKSDGEVIFGLGLVDVNNPKKNVNRSPKRYRRPISDTPLAHNKPDLGNVSTMSSPVLYHHTSDQVYPRFTFNNFAEGTALRPGSTKILDLSALSESTLESEENREGPEITPYPDIEVQATPVVFHKPKTRKKRKSNKTKKEVTKDQHNEKKPLNNAYTSRLHQSHPGKYNYHFKYSQVVKDKIFFEQNGRIVTIRKGPQPDIVLKPDVDVIHLQQVKNNKKETPTKDTPAKISVTEEEGIEKPEVKAKPSVLKTEDAQEVKSPKKVVQFGPDMIREVTKYTFPQSDVSDRDIENDFEVTTD